MTTGITNSSQSGSKIERYERLISLYDQLLIELDDLHKEGLVVKDQLHQVIDRSKMEQLLDTIKNTKFIS